MPPVVPHRVELRVQVEQLRCLLQRFGRVVLRLFLFVSLQPSEATYPRKYVFLQRQVRLDLTQLLQPLGLRRLG